MTGADEMNPEAESDSWPKASPSPGTPMAAIQDALSECVGRELSGTEIDELLGELGGIASLSQSGKSSNPSPLVRAVRLSIAPVLRGLERGQTTVGVLQQTARRLGKLIGRWEQAGLPEKGALVLSRVRLDELGPLLDRFKQLSLRVAATSTNVKVELLRSGEVERETVALLADDVRKMSENAESLSRRLGLEIGIVSAELARLESVGTEVSEEKDASNGAGRDEMMALSETIIVAAEELSSLFLGELSVDSAASSTKAAEGGSVEEGRRRSVVEEVADELDSIRELAGRLRAKLRALEGDG